MNRPEFYRGRHKYMDRVSIVSPGETLQMKAARVHRVGGRFVLCRGDGCCDLVPTRSRMRILTPLLIYDTTRTMRLRTFKEHRPVAGGLHNGGFIKPNYELENTRVWSIRLRKPLSYRVMPWIVNDRMYAKLWRVINDTTWCRDLYLYCHNQDFQTIGVEGIKECAYMARCTDEQLKEIQNRAQQILDQAEGMLAANVSLDEIAKLAEKDREAEKEREKVATA